MVPLVRMVGACVVAVGALAAQEPWQAQHDEAKRFYNAGKYPEALAVLDRCVQDHGRAVPLLLMRTQCRREVGDLAGALADAQSAIELEPGVAELWFSRGYVRHCQKDFTGAISDYDEAIRLSPRNAVAFGSRGDTRLQLGDLMGARADYDAALRIDRKNVLIVENRAKVNILLGAWAAALGDLTRAIDLRPSQWTTWNALAAVQAQLGRWSGVLTSVEKGLSCEGADKRQMLARRVRAHWRCGDHAAAIAARQSALVAAESPAATALERQLLGCLQFADGQTDAARASFAACAADAAMRPWATVMTWCLGADNAAADRELRAAVAAWPSDTPESARRMVEDCLEPPDLAVPTSGDELERTCVVAFLRGWRARRDGKTDDAHRWFVACIDTSFTDGVQWDITYALLELRPDSPAALGCELRAVPDADPPRLEVASLAPGGPAALFGLRVGARVAMVNDQPATPDTFAAATKALVLGTSVRFAIEGDPKRAEVRVCAGIAAR